MKRPLEGARETHVGKFFKMAQDWHATHGNNTCKGGNPQTDKKKKVKGESEVFCHPKQDTASITCWACVTSSQVQAKCMRRYHRNLLRTAESGLGPEGDTC